MYCAGSNSVLHTRLYRFFRWVILKKCKSIATLSPEEISCKTQSQFLFDIRNPNWNRLGVTSNRFEINFRSTTYTVDWNTKETKNHHGTLPRNEGQLARSHGFSIPCNMSLSFENGKCKISGNTRFAFGMYANAA